MGRGAFGKVSLSMHKLSQQPVAIKSIKKDSDFDIKKRILQEIEMISAIQHENVIRMFDSFETQKHICFVIELCSGGDLYSYIKKRRRL